MTRPPLGFLLLLGLAAAAGGCSGGGGKGDPDGGLDRFPALRQAEPLPRTSPEELGIDAFVGDTVAARQLLADNVMMGKGATAQGEIRVTLAGILAHSADSSDRQQAEFLYRDAINMYESTLGVYRSSATNYMWLGIAYLEMGEHAQALDYLNVAEFIETRAFYNGMIQLWLGRTYLAMDEGEKARDHLANVLATPSSDYHQRQARALLEQLSHN